MYTSMAVIAGGIFWQSDVNIAAGISLLINEPAIDRNHAAGPSASAKGSKAHRGPGVWKIPDISMAGTPT